MKHYRQKAQECYSDDHGSTTGGARNVSHYLLMTKDHKYRNDEQASPPQITSFRRTKSGSHILLTLDA
ncbi:hypothetical protein E2C01_038057 [Portunus trituberculatus]|uniref:Uncharacterized protein n=1 Tax=Portunus trituberculatus TaxID=210409 RepID=A0A5B7FIW2_PORTR|nr:hypothetical protein [Portunus trituberculatus]